MKSKFEAAAGRPPLLAAMAGSLHGKMPVVIIRHVSSGPAPDDTDIGV